MSLNAKVLVTNPVDAVGEAILREAGCRIVQPSGEAQETLYDLVVDADALIVRSKIPDDLLDHGPRLRAVVRHGVGLDFLPMARATALGIAVANVPGANAEAVAEYVFAAFLELARQLGKLNAELRESDWWTARARSAGALELWDKCLGIVGVGNVGQRVARIGGLGFGMRVLASEPRLGALQDFVSPTALPDLFAQSDFIALCCPLTPQTHRLVGADLIGRMKSTACLVNAARGEVIDDDALVAALRERRIGGAALDVFAAQPLPRGHPYLSLDNLVLTPHLAGLTVESMQRMSKIACEEAVRMLRGEQPVNSVNPEVWHSSRRRGGPR